MHEPSLSTMGWYCRLVRDHHLHKYFPPAADWTPQKRKTKKQIITARQKNITGAKNTKTQLLVPKKSS